MRVKLPDTFYPTKEYIKVVAIDPGMNIGLATAVLLREVGEDHNIWSVEATTHVLQWPDDTDLLTHDDLHLADVVIVEQFIPRGLGVDLTPVEVIGHIRGVLQQRGQLDKLVFQQPAQIKARGIKRLTMERFGVIPEATHEQDALSHLTVWLLKQGKKVK